MAKGFTSAILLAGLGAILFSAKAIVVKLCYAHGADAATVLALRMLFSLPFFWSAVWWVNKTQNLDPVCRKDRFALIVLGFLGYYVSSYLDFLGLETITVGLERIILYLTPAIVLVLSQFLLNKIISKRQWIAMAVAYLGVIVVFAQDVQFDGLPVVIGGLFVFASAISYAIYLIYSGEIVSRVGSIRLVAYASASATFFSVLQALVVNPVALWSQPMAVYQLSVFNGSFCTFVPMLFIMIAVNRVGSGLAAQAGAIGPVATIFLGWYFLAERISVLQIVGMAIVLISMGILLTVNRNQRPHLIDVE
jgi:drug/metabolite transporter (DMT)-like permease